MRMVEGSDTGIAPGHFLCCLRIAASAPERRVRTLCLQIRTMSNTATAQASVDTRREQLARTLGRGLEPGVPIGPPLPSDQVEHLRSEAEELYWNELSWEELTDEETVSGGHLTELVFPGFLAFVEGLLNDSVPADSTMPPRPHPEIVEEILTFLAEQAVDLSNRLEEGADSERVVRARAMTFDLIDLTLHRLHDVSSADRERLERAG